MVVPHAGTWIEIHLLIVFVGIISSFPTRERGLKLLPKGSLFLSHKVVPHAGTWIEIVQQYTNRNASCRSPRGNVD